MSERRPELSAELAVHPEIQIFEITQRSARFERLIPLEKLKVGEALLAPVLQLGVTPLGGEQDTVKAQVRLGGEPSPGSLPDKTAFTFELVYEVTFKVAELRAEGQEKAGLLESEDLWRIVIPTVTWPFLRAEVAAATSRLGLPPLILPLVAVPSEIRIMAAGQSPSPGDHGRPQER